MAFCKVRVSFSAYNRLWAPKIAMKSIAPKLYHIILPRVNSLGEKTTQIFSMQPWTTIAKDNDENKNKVDFQRKPCYNLFMETKNKPQSLKIRLFLAFEYAKQDELTCQMAHCDTMYGKMKFKMTLRETNIKINFLEKGDLAGYLGYN